MMIDHSRNQHHIKVDVLIVGGGFVGNTLAAALAGASVSSAMVDTADLGQVINAEFDGRSFAVSLSNKRLLEGVGIWQDLAAQTAPILDIRISDGPSLMFLHYDHRETGDDPMGFMVENHYLRRALYLRLQASDAVRVFAPDRVERLIRDQHGVSATLQSGAKIWARLVVGADGRDSMVRADAGIATTKWTYNQSGIVCTVRHERHHNFIAHERFLSAGPFAILPLQGDPPEAGNRSSLVWTENSVLTPTVMGLNEDEFRDEVRQRLGDFLGEVNVAGPRYVFPLGLQFAQRLMDRRMALVGDAAHAMHPIAGQGLNMGLRDVAALAEVLVDAERLGQDIGDEQVLARYVRWRRFDNTLMLAATDGLNRLFSNDVGPLRLARDFGLAAINRLPPVKRLFMRHAMGLVGDLPRLLRGERLV